MIPADYISEWRQYAPWTQDLQVEHDLIVSRALVEMLQQSELRSSLAFRGGTALNKLYFNPPRRYSEDIDLVHEGRVSRAEFEANLTAKLSDSRFTEDVAPLLARYVPWSLDKAAGLVQSLLVSRLPGEPWRGLRDGEE